MSKVNFERLKQSVKYQRWQLRRLAVQRKYSREECLSVPILFGNSMPKAGSHLLFQVLNGMADLGPFVITGMSTVNRDETNQNVPVKQVMDNLRQLKPGDIGFGKLFCEPPFIEALTHPSMATINIYRDPRDLAVSITRYATDIHLGHSLHNHLTKVLKTDEERLELVIKGSDGPDIYRVSLRERYLKYIGWLDQPVLSIRFEDLINDRRNTLGRVLDFIAEKGHTPSISREESIGILETAIQPKKSGTFRKGQPGEWRSVFSPAIKRLFKETMGDVLQQLGYESSSDW